MATYRLRKPLKAASYDPAEYGLVPDEKVKVDHALGDPTLATR